MPGRILTSRDIEICEVLTHRVRVLSLPQIARTWWPTETLRAAEARIRVLATEGLLQLERALTHPELTLERPVVEWTPGQPSPDFGQASHTLQARWQLDPIRLLCASATRTAAERFGGYGGRPPRAVEQTHDIHMAQVFLNYRAKHPALVPYWVFEERTKVERREASTGEHEKLPDAFIRTAESTKAVEFGGRYSKKKLSAFHSYCTEHALPYEIW